MNELPRIKEMAENADLYQLAASTGDSLLKADLRLATAESCTGGWVAKAITDVAGSSRWFERGFVCYSNDAKREMLGIAERTLAEHGAVSKQVAVEMARGAVANRRAQISVSVTGVAGPTGGTAEKPVGLVWFAWYRNGGTLATYEARFNGDRLAIRHQAAATALRGLLEFVAGSDAS